MGNKITTIFKCPEIHESQNNINPDLKNIIMKYVGEVKPNDIKKQATLVKSLLNDGPSVHYFGNYYIPSYYQDPYYYNSLNDINFRDVFSLTVTSVHVERYKGCGCSIMLFTLSETMTNNNEKPVIPRCVFYIMKGHCDNLETNCNRNSNIRWKIYKENSVPRPDFITEHYEKPLSARHHYDVKDIRFISGEHHILAVKSRHLKKR